MKTKALNIQIENTGSLTDRGLVRKENQDEIFSTTDTPNGLSVVQAVADGMGGHKGGSEASKLAINTLRERCKGFQGNQIKSFLQSVIESANTKIITKGNNSKLSGMGTTLTILIFGGSKYYYGHIGDSRAYLFRDEKIIRITNDHSLVAEMVKNKEISEKEARNHPQRNVITKALGINHNIVPDIHEGKIKTGDKFLICSDGLHGLVSDQEIKNIVNKYEPKEACKRLVKKAKSNGGHDNISVVIASTKNKNTIKNLLRKILPI